MKKLSEILGNSKILMIQGSVDIAVSAIQLDSREVTEGDLFVAINGTLTDGHLFITKAIEKGATAIVCEKIPTHINEAITYVQVEDSAHALAIAAANFYNNPSSKLKLIGITGTNGKTTVATLSYQLFSALGYHVGLLSTVKNLIGDRQIPATHTTPNPVALNWLLNEMVEIGCDYCFMEVSSHAIVQQRISGLEFSGAIFTNITHDHLDFHGTFDRYIKAKKAFFDSLPSYAFALTNTDDKNGMVMLQNTPAHKKNYALKSLADYKGKIIESHFNGMLLNIDGHEVWVKLVGAFNAYNVMATYGAAMLLDQDRAKVLTILSKINGAEGRFEPIVSEDGRVAIVDYAHTPDALENVLETIADLRTGDAQIITVIGCGGDRDKTKRPEMAKVAVNLSDKVILTSDNPRNEDPSAILQEMEMGISMNNKRKYFIISDRREAIRAACHLAQPRDIILVAGKGHETYQEIKGVRYPFDDREVLNITFNEY